jgi:hypothetical protein
VPRLRPSSTTRERADNTEFRRPQGAITTHRNYFTKSAKVKPLRVINISTR